MNRTLAPLTVAGLALLGLPFSAAAHDLSGAELAIYNWAIKPPGADGTPVQFLVQAGGAPRTAASPAPASPAPATTATPAQAAAFAKFAPKVQVRWDERFLFVEGNGLPAHNMMVGITAWQQQVPLPQNYTGANAWQIPLKPVPAKEPASIKNRFLRGAIAIAANGIPIFNPQNNRGEISAEIGELDQWGGHCGRADDYHYHAAPLHLQNVLGKGLPIAFALDGYAIYGLTEPDGTPPAGLDALSGHTTAALGYHYHASTKYPYVNGGFHGEVTERNGQVDPQPRAQPVRTDQPPLRGAKITDFETPTANTFKLGYEVKGEKRAVLYTVNADKSVAFEFQNGSEGTRQETVTPRPGGGGGGGRDEGGGPPPDGQRPPREDGGDRPPRRGPNGPNGPNGPGGPEDRSGGGGRQERQGPGKDAPIVGMDSLKKPNAAFVLSSPEVANGGPLPVDFSGDGTGATLPLAWKGAPAGTQSYALIMDHLAPGDSVKSYWVMWDIPAATTSLAKNAQGIGKLGTSFKGIQGYEPPHSQGPGPKTYVLTVYALSAPPQLTQAPREVTREALLTAIQGKVLASASLSVVSERKTNGAAGPSIQSTPSIKSIPSNPRQGAGEGLVKAAMSDTIKAAVYADNWFALYINGRLTAVDPIAFLPHNVVTLDILPEYPMTIAVIAHDNADPKTGLEYGNHIGDAGLIIKFADGTVTDGTWKVKAIERGPIGRDLANPRTVSEARPANWFMPAFDDSAWENATVFTEERVNPKAPFYEHDFKGAQFIWSKDLDLDNTVLFRKRIDKPGWTPRWTAQPAGPTPQP